MKEYKVTVRDNGTVEWRNLKGELDRDDGPAEERADGSKFWYKNGLRHRDNNLPAEEFADGTKSWMVNGLLHRENGPAVVGGGGYEAFYLKGASFSKEDHKLWTTSREGEVIESYGRKYKLVEIKD